MDATPKPGTVIVVETAVCRNCTQGISRLANSGEPWHHNDESIRCWAAARRRSAPVTPEPKEEFL